MNVTITFAAPGVVGPLLAGVGDATSVPNPAPQPNPWIFDKPPEMYALAIGGFGTAGTAVDITFAGVQQYSPSPAHFVIGGPPGAVRPIVDHVYFQV
jgi:hypothetical protein